MSINEAWVGPRNITPALCNGTILIINSSFRDYSILGLLAKTKAKGFD